MRINLTQTKSMKRYLVYTTDDLRLRPFDPTRFFAPPPNENRLNSRPVEKVGLEQISPDMNHGGRCRGFYPEPPHLGFCRAAVGRPGRRKPPLIEPGRHRREGVVQRRTDGFHASHDR